MKKQPSDEEKMALLTKLLALLASKAVSEQELETELRFRGYTSVREIQAKIEQWDTEFFQAMYDWANVKSDHVRPPHDDANYFSVN